MLRLVSVVAAAMVVAAFPVLAGAQVPGQTTPAASVTPTTVEFPATATATGTFTVDTAYPGGTTVEVGFFLLGTAGTGTFTGFTPSVGLAGCAIQPTTAREIVCTVADPTQTGQHTLDGTIAVGDATGLTPLAYDIQVFARANQETVVDSATLNVQAPSTTTTTTTTTVVPDTTLVPPTTVVPVPPSGGTGAGNLSAATTPSNELAVTGSESPWIVVLALGLLLMGAGGLLLGRRPAL